MFLRRVPYALDVIKSGTSLGSIDLSRVIRHASKDHDNLTEKGYLTVGRAPDADILLDHPSTSRLHAVLQFRDEDDAAFIYDAGSTHGTYLNKKKINKNEYVRVHVGDHIRFGESTRTYVLSGPMEMMPEEGPNKHQKLQEAAMQAFQRPKELEEKAAKDQMMAALSRQHVSDELGATWGMGFDDDEPTPAEDAEIGGGKFNALLHDGLLLEDWREYARLRGLNANQQKLANRVHKKEARLRFLARECDRIRSKQERGFDAEGELSAGQREVLSRNMEETDRIRIEIDELEDKILESIQHSLKNARGASVDDPRAAGKSDLQLPADDDDDDDDAFYDRTNEGKSRKRRPGFPRLVGVGDLQPPSSKHAKLRDLCNRKGSSGAVARGEEAIDAVSLHQSLKRLEEERDDMLKQIEKAQERETSASAARDDEERKQRTSIPVFGEPSASDAGGNDGKVVDSLDVYMVQNTMDLDKNAKEDLLHRLKEVGNEIVDVERLLRIADPDGYFRGMS